MIAVADVSYTYPGADATAVRKLTFDVGQGEIFGLLGPSGAGKSTTQKILVGLLRNYAGSVQVFGRELRHWSQSYYEQIGVAFELPNHFMKLTARENLAYFGSLYRRATRPIEPLLAQIGLDDALDTPVSAFSKGMQTRLGVARALLHNPSLLFLDEPTSGLDPAYARDVKALLKAERERGTTIIITTHSMALAEELCDRVAFVADGEIRLIDAPDALKLRYGRSVVLVEQDAPEGALTTAFPLDGLADNRAFFDVLRSGTVRTMHTREATLDDVFVHVTGRSLR